MLNGKPGEGGDSWLERELTRELREVKAPDVLWARIQERRRPKRGMTTGFYRTSLLVAALALITASASVALRLSVARDLGPADLAPEMMRAAGERVACGWPRLGVQDCRSNNPGTIRVWVKAKAGIDVPLPAEMAVDGGVRLLGAQMIEVRGVRMAAIDYRVGNEAAVLLVARAPRESSGSAATGHAFFGKAAWRMKDAAYAVASSRACVLCHAGEQDGRSAL